MKLYDKDIREPLFDYLEEKYGKVRIIEEKQIGKHRTDVLVVTETFLMGIEIKSDADSYTRLEGQVKEYNKYFDYNWVVVGTKHAHHIEEHVPLFWGIITVERSGDEVDFYKLRKASLNPKCKLKNKLSILWRRELVNIQEKYHLPSYKQKSKKFVQEKILEKIDHDDLNLEISRELFDRDYTTIEEDIENYRKKPKIKNGE